MECNVIGERVVDALAIVDKYLDSCSYSRLHQVRIVHGVGSGALRTSIWNYLKRSKYVESFTGDTFKEAKEYLENGQKVLYTGSPCQIAGLKKYIKSVRIFSRIFIFIIRYIK